MLLPVRQAYSRAERLSDAVIHVSGIAFVAVAVPVLIAVALWAGAGGLAVAGAAVYGATLAAMICFSAAYNMARPGRWKAVLRRLDHSAIYAKIAGTYTPFTLAAGPHAGWLLAGLWGAALAGIGLKTVSPERLKWLALALYLAMGWAGVAAGSAFTAHLSTPVLALIVTGGILYTLGVVFFLFERLPFHYTIWHVFVLAASAVFYAAVTLHVVQAAA